MNASANCGACMGPARRRSAGSSMRGATACGAMCSAARYGGSISNLAPSPRSMWVAARGFTCVNGGFWVRRRSAASIFRFVRIFGFPEGAPLPDPLLWTEFIHADIGAVGLAISAGRFDAVTAIDVLTHVLDDGAYSRALANIHRALKPGGHLLYTDSFFHGPGKRHEDYWRGRTLAEATEAIEASGFEIVSRVPFSVLMSAPTDTRHRERNERLWEAVLRPFLSREWTGFLLGAVLYPAERALVRLLRESPAIELMCCRKRGHEAPTR